MMDVHPVIQSLPAVNAALNAISATLIICGLVHIRRRNRKTHERFMWAAAGVSAVFLVSYLVKTWFLGTTTYGGEGLLRVIYFTVLFSHLILAIVIVPLVLISLVHALSKRFDKHRRIARITAPVWLYVSVTGVIVYFMLRPWY